jgi:hypothetical protein
LPLDKEHWQAVVNAMGISQQQPDCPVFYPSAVLRQQVTWNSHDSKTIKTIHTRLPKGHQRFRFVVIDRKITQGTRGETGRRWCERIWTVLATCAQQGHSAFDFLYHSISAHFTSKASPSLLPIPP